MKVKSRMLWGALWRSDSRVSGPISHIINTSFHMPALFLTRREAREFIEEKYGYIKTRPDLKAQPHGWKVPVPIRVKISRVGAG